MLPPIERKEWHNLVTEAINPYISSHLFRIRLTGIRNKVKRKQITPAEGIKELYADCQAHIDIYQNDIHRIFSKANAGSL